MTTDPVLVAEASAALTALSVWVDGGNDHRDPEAVTWGRLSKITEEAGEVIAAWIGVTGQNTRKGRTHTVRDVEAELYDVAVTALTAVAHLRSNLPGDHVMHDLCTKLVAVADRAGCLPADNTYGPQTAAIKALIARAAVLTPDEAERLQNAGDAAGDAVRDAARVAAWGAAR